MKNQGRSTFRGSSGTRRGKSSAQKSIADHMTWDGQEHRRHERFRVNWRGVLARSVSDSRRTMEVQVLNISEGGCCVHVRELSRDQTSLSFLGVEERLNLNVYLPGAVLNSWVEVRWYVPVHDEVYGAGLEFIAMTQRDRSLLQSAMQDLAR